MTHHTLLILYGSQTGNAQDVAETIALEARERHFVTRVAPADAYLKNSIDAFPNESAVLCVVSTTGQGDPPDNYRLFWQFLRRKNLASDALQNVHAAVFGLGDSAYLKYNYMAKLLHRRLQSLGANMLLSSPGLADDQHPGGADATLDEWLPRFFRSLRQVFPLPDSLSEPAPDERVQNMKPKYLVDLVDGEHS